MTRSSASWGMSNRWRPFVGLRAKRRSMRYASLGVLTLVDDLNAQEIDLPHMEAGIALARFYLAEALRLFHASATEPDLVLAEKLLTWAQPHEVIYLRQVYQFGPNSIRDAKTARRIVSILVEHGWLVRIKGGAGD